MNCISCQFPLPAVAKFCLECGAKQPIYCQCGQELPTTAKFCMECGTSVKEITSTVEQAVSTAEETKDVISAETTMTEPQGALLEESADPGSPWQQGQLLEESAPVVAESDPVVAESAPVVAESDPVVAESAPVVAESAPVVAESAPVVAESAPVVADSAPVVADSAPVVAESEPVVAESAPVVAESAPVVAESEPVVADSAPVVAESAPVVAESAPVVAESAPVVADSDPFVEETEEEFSNKAHLMEFYGLTLRTELNLFLRRFRGKLYYYHEEKQAICDSNEDGSDERVIIHCMGKPSGMFVNQTGVYLYYFEHLEIGIPRYTLDGLHIATMDVPSHAQMKDVYVHEDTAYVAVSELMDFELGKDYSHCRGDVLNMARDKRKDLIYYLNYSDQTQKAFHFYGEQGDFRIICANEMDIVFMANFSGDIDGVLEKNQGYYRYNKAHNTIASLSHRACQPHWLASDKERYQKICQENQKSAQGFSIPFFDMEHKMMWVEQSDEKGNYLEARSMDSPGKSEVRTDMPKWYYKIPSTAFDRVYFDGLRMYYLQNEDSLLSILVDGSEVMLTAQDHCQKFVMAEEFIYVYSQNYDLHQHKALSHGLPLVRNLPLQFQ